MGLWIRMEWWKTIYSDWEIFVVVVVINIKKPPNFTHNSNINMSSTWPLSSKSFNLPSHHAVRGVWEGELAVPDLRV